MRNLPSVFQSLPLFPIYATQSILTFHSSVSLSDYMMSTVRICPKGKSPELTTCNNDKGNKKKIIQQLLLKVINREKREGVIGKRDTETEREREKEKMNSHVANPRTQITTNSTNARECLALLPYFALVSSL